MQNDQVKVETPAKTETKAAVVPKDDFVLTSAMPEPAETVETQSASTEEAQETELAAASEATENEDHHGEESEEELEAVESETTETQPGKKKGGFQKRIDKLTKQRAAEQREKEYWKQEALKAKSNPGEQTETPAKVETKAPVEISKRPDPNDPKFESHDAYEEALADWRYDQRRAAEKAQERETSLKAEHQKMLDSHMKRVNEFKKATPDFVDVMDDIGDAPMSMAVRHAIVESEFGPQLMYEFGKNPAELERINALTPSQAERAIGRMEAGFESSSEKTSKVEPETAVEKPAPKVTKAPKPISTINSKAGHVKTLRDNLPYEEWAKLRRAELKNG